MKNTLLFSTLAIGLALTGCNKSTRTSTSTAADTTPPVTTATTPTTTDTVGARVDRATDRVADATRQAGREIREAGQDLSARMTEWRLSTTDIEADLAANKNIVRTKTTTTPAGNVDAKNIEGMIKGKLQADSKLADLKFDVNANRKGEVELEGKARTADQVAAAMADALDTEGVVKVTSKIRLDPKAGPNH